MTAGVRQFVDILLEDGLVTEQQLVARADIAFYAAKQGGRNRVVAAP